MREIEFWKFFFLERGKVRQTARKVTPVLIIDEAHLLKQNVFTQLHTLTQFEFDSKPVMPVILCGQDGLMDHLMTSSGQASGFPCSGNKSPGSFEKGSYGRVSSPPFEAIRAFKKHILGRGRFCHSSVFWRNPEKS